MPPFDQLVEQRIAEAMEQGAFDDLPGAGKPLDLDDDRLVPEELRVAHRILRNAGFLPLELEKRREAARLHELLAAAAGDEAEERRVRVRLALLETALEGRGTTLRTSAPYYRIVVDKLAKGG